MIELGGKLFNRDHISAVVPVNATEERCILLLLGGDHVTVPASYDDIKAALNG